MSDYKLVPVEPTPEMVDAAEDAYMPFGDMELALRMAILTAPAVQGEPVAFCEDAALSIAERTFSTEVDEQLASDIIQYAQRLHSLYAAPQPAEQAVPSGFRVMKPTGSAVREGERWEIYAPCGSGGIAHEDEVTSWVVRKLLDALSTAPQPAEQQTVLLDDDSLERQVGEIGNQIHNLGCEYQNDEKLADRLAEIAHQAWTLQSSVMISKQQPAPDVAGLVEALVACARASSAAEVGLIVDAALAAHRKQEGSHDNQ